MYVQHKNTYKLDLTKFDVIAYLHNKGMQANPRTHAADMDVAFNCFFCGDKAPNKYHLSVNKYSTMFNCWLCSRSGNAWTFLRHFGDRLYNVREYIRDAQFFEEHAHAKPKKSWYGELPEFFTPIGELKVLPTYLVKKGFDRRKLEKYRVGYCDLGVMAKRVIFPIYCGGRLISFIGKSICKGVKPYNPEGVRFSELLYNYDVAKLHDTCVIVEGVTDAIAIGSNAVALFGKSMSTAQLNLILKARFSKVVVCLDDDAHSATLRIAAKLALFVNTCVVLLKNGDPCDHKNINDILYTQAKAYSGDLCST